MTTTLDHEAATADLLTDIVAPLLHRSVPDAEVCDLVRELAAGSSVWRDAWSFDSHPHGVVDESARLPQGLTHEEDDELRRLNWLSQTGSLGGRKIERLLELRLQDRRKEIRVPREVAEAERVVVTSALQKRHSQQPQPRHLAEQLSHDNVAEGPPTDLHETRCRLDRIVKVRLLRALSDEEQRLYRELLALEEFLLKFDRP